MSNSRENSESAHTVSQGQASTGAYDELRLSPEYEGWHRVTTADNAVVEYWKRGSTHVMGTHEQLLVQLSRDEETLRLTQHTYDQFGHSLARSTKTLSEQPTERVGYIKNRLERYMTRYPGDESFDCPPTFPDRLGVWTAVCRQNYYGAEATQWVFDPDHRRDQEGDWGPVQLPDDSAVLSLEETDIRGGYSHIGHYYIIRYRDAAVETTIATDVPRTFAFELAEQMLTSLPRPVAAMKEKREALQSIDGVGPAKSRDLLLLGLSDAGDLRQYLDDGSATNHYHADRVDAVLSSRIISSIED